MSVSYQVAPAGPLRGTLRVPGDKSISHRALILGGLGEGTTEVSGLLEGADVLATRAALLQLGVQISAPQSGQCEIQGAGTDGLQAPHAPLDLGNSGTAMRLLAGVLAGQRFGSVLVGDASLSRRPMQRIVAPLQQMGARIESDQGRPPLRIEASQQLVGIDYSMPVASAQVKSCLLLAGLQARGTTRIREPLPSRDHSERMLAAFGLPVAQHEGWLVIKGGRRLRSPGLITVPGDISSAAFWLVAASLVPDSELLLQAVGINPLRAGVIDILQRMGARIELIDQRETCGEPVADIRVRSARLHGVDISGAEVPAAIDEFPVLFVAAALAGGRTRIVGAAELRTKESDRIAVMVAALRRMGAAVEALDDGVVIQGGALRAAQVDSAGDHRCAMALAVAGAAAQGCRVADVANVATSYPGFARQARALGLQIEETAA